MNAGNSTLSSCLPLLSLTLSLSLSLSLSILPPSGAPLFLGDNQGNTPLHLATWQNHPPTVDFLCAKGQEFTRAITSSKVLVNPGQSFQDLAQEIFQELQHTKLRPIETRRFQKRWLYEASVLFRTKMSPLVRHMIAPTCVEIMDDVLHRFDPRPETGIFVSTAIEDQLLFIPTIPSANELSILLQYIFRQSALDCTNSWNRTSLHLACDENTIASHREVILLLIHKYGCNVMLQDIHYNTPYDLLINTDQQLQQQATTTSSTSGLSTRKGPTATSLRESLIYDQRVPKILEIMKNFELIDRQKLDEKRREILQECRHRADEMNLDLWESTRLSSLLKTIYINKIGIGSSMVTSTWSHYIDLDTKNEFFCCQPKDLSLGDTFSNFSWTLPKEVCRVFHHNNAFNYQRISQTQVVRQVENWVTMRSERYGIIYYMNAESDGGMAGVAGEGGGAAAGGGGGVEYLFHEPPVYNWKLVARHAVYQATYGYGDEWQEYSKDNLTFYFNKVTRKYCWERPMEAVSVTPGERFCTAYKVRINTLSSHTHALYLSLSLTHLPFRKRIVALIRSGTHVSNAIRP
jgi:ankyrin repeat protein